MDELDQLLQELSAPKAIDKPAPAPVAQVQAVHTVEAPRPQKVDFEELDDLMAELGTGSKPAPPPAAAAPAATAAPAAKSAGLATVDDLLAELSAAPAGGAAPAASAPSVAAPQSSFASAAPARKDGMDELDAVMSTLQGMSTKPAAAAPAPAAAPSSAAGRRNDLDNILNSLSSEMSQIGVDSDFKGQCAMCKKSIIGQVVTALGRTWHPEHFGCMQCRKPLNSASFFERDNLPYCEKCFHDMFAPKCAYCDGPIKDRCVNALGKTWHPDHFFCSQCGKHFSGGGFMEKDGKAYCEEDYFNMFAPKCGGCEKPIMAECITALGRQWHPQCFVCMECHESFNQGSFFDHDGKPYCETHYHQQKGSLCASCQKPILGRCVTALHKRFHPEHFVCAFCMKQLAKGTFKENGSKAYCTNCYVKLFG